ncbi:hypothetical protein LV779_03330 [Streptomyces thinghirensis]|nr:hypothetical protein [Streptomyces thinghirensis]
MPWTVAGEHGRVVLHVELLAVLGVRPPAPLHPQRLPGLRAEQRADDGQQVAGASAGVDSGDRVAVLLIGVRDALQDTFEGGESPFTGSGIGLVRHDPTVPVGV